MDASLPVSAIRWLVRPLPCRVVLTVLLAACLAIGGDGASAAELQVHSAAEIHRALKRAQPGDVLVMADGAWDDQAIKFTGQGTKDKPITLRAQTPGKVQLRGRSRITVDGQYLVISGLWFGDASSTDDIVSITGTENRFTDSAIVAPMRGGKWVHFRGGQRNRMDHCYLAGHAPQDVTVQVQVDRQTPNHHRIDHNHFGPRPPLGKNGGETIRIGYSSQSLWNSRTIVEHNLFDRCDGELEIISSKSCENVYRYNTFRDCAGTLTLRHGDRCIVDGNYFLGLHGGKRSGGVRVIGRQHTIINNYFENLQPLAGGVVTLTAGVPDSPLAGYWQVQGGLVAHNTFANVDLPAVQLDGGYDRDANRVLLAENVVLANNLMWSGDGDAASATWVAGRAGRGFQATGNVGFGAEPGETVADAFRQLDPQMIRTGDGVWQPSVGSPLRGAALPVTAVEQDIHGQPRPPQHVDVGCDQASDEPVINVPLTVDAVGPRWDVPGER